MPLKVAKLSFPKSLILLTCPAGFLVLEAAGDFLKQFKRWEWDSFFKTPYGTVAKPLLNFKRKTVSSWENTAGLSETPFHLFFFSSVGKSLVYIYLMISGLLSGCGLGHLGWEDILWTDSAFFFPLLVGRT